MPLEQDIFSAKALRIYMKQKHSSQARGNGDATQYQLNQPGPCCNLIIPMKRIHASVLSHVKLDKLRVTKGHPNAKTVRMSLYI